DQLCCLERGEDVDRCRGVRLLRAQLAEEAALGERAGFVGELSGRAVVADAVGAVIVDEPTKARRDIVEHDRPSDPCAVDRWVIESMRIVIDGAERTTFRTRIALR